MLPRRSLACCLWQLAGQVYTTLDTFISNVHHAPSFANCIRIEVDCFRSSLNALHTLLSSWTAPPRRAALVPADFIVLTFTDATLLFSEIEAEVLPLVQLDGFDFVARSRWTLKKNSIGNIGVAIAVAETNIGSAAEYFEVVIVLLVLEMPGLNELIQGVVLLKTMLIRNLLRSPRTVCRSWPTTKI